MRDFRNPYKNYCKLVTIYYPLKEYYINKNPDINYNALTFNPLTDTLYTPIMKPKTNYFHKKKTVSITRMIDGFSVFFPDNVNLHKEHKMLELYSSYCVLRSGVAATWKGQFEDLLTPLYWDTAFKLMDMDPIESVITREEFTIENLVKYDLLVDSDLYDTASFIEVTSKTFPVDTFTSEYRFDNLLTSDKRGQIGIRNREALDTLSQYLNRDYYSPGELEQVILEEFNKIGEDGKPIQEFDFLNNIYRCTRAGRLYVKICDPVILESLRRGNCLSSGFAYKWASKYRIQHFKKLTRMLEQAMDNHLNSYAVVQEDVEVDFE